jgi:hypothetical protein
MSDETVTRTFPERLLAAAGEVANIEKNGKNDFHKYEYLMEADVKRAVNAAFQKHGLAVVGTTMKLLDGSKFDATMVHVSLTVASVDGPGSATFEGIGGGTDKGDKSIFKAIAGAVKYACTTGLLIAAGGDPEADEATDRKPAARTESSKEEAPAKSAPKAAKSSSKEPSISDLREKVAAAKTLEDLTKIRATVSAAARTGGEGADELKAEYVRKGAALKAAEKEESK